MPGTPLQIVAGTGSTSLVSWHLRARDVCVAAIALELRSCRGHASFPHCRTGTREFRGCAALPPAALAERAAVLPGDGGLFPNAVGVCLSVCPFAVRRDLGPAAPKLLPQVNRGILLITSKLSAPADAMPASQRPCASANTVTSAARPPPQLLTPAALPGRKEEGDSCWSHCSCGRAALSGWRGMRPHSPGRGGCGVPTMAPATPLHQPLIPHSLPSAPSCTDTHPPALGRGRLLPRPAPRRATSPWGDGNCQLRQLVHKEPRSGPGPLPLTPPAGMTQSTPS